MMTPDGPVLCMTPRAMLCMIYMSEPEDTAPELRALTARFQAIARPRFEVEKVTALAPRSLAAFLHDEFGGAELHAEIGKACGVDPGKARNTFEVVADVLDRMDVPEAG